MSEANRNHPDIPRPKLLAIIGLQTVAFTLLGLVGWWASGRDVAGFYAFDHSEIWQGVALGLVLSAIAAASFVALPRLTDRLVRYQGETYFFLKDKLSAPAIVWVSLCAGVGEEAFFRGGMQTLLDSWLGPMPAILISATIFALVHMAKPAVAIIIFAIGALFGTIFWYTDSLAIVMIGHAVYDVFAIAYLQHRLHAIGYFADAPKDEGEPDATD